MARCGRPLSKRALWASRSPRCWPAGEPGECGRCPPDLVDRQFTVTAPKLLVVADVAYVWLATGVFVDTAFVIDAYAGRNVGW